MTKRYIMSQAGYSPRSFIEKLGIKPEFSVAVLNIPQKILPLFDTLPDGVKLTHSLSDQLDLIHYFTKDQDELVKMFPRFAAAVKKDGMVWISWPKGSSKIPTDLNENMIRDIGIENGMVDVKVIAVDENWSGLKFIYKLKDRN
jgi:hypothetical protein